LIVATLLSILAATAAPPPHAPIPREPAALAQRLDETDAALSAAIGRWEHPERGAPPTDVTLLALYQQRIYLRLSSRPGLAEAVLARLPSRRAAHLRDSLAARRELVRLTKPRPLSAFRTARPRPAGVLLRYYGEAERRFGVAWQVLAAVNFVESAFGKLRNASNAGAQGPMQFLPSTWRAYGLGGDVHDPHDAILGAANYLRASGARRSYRRALYAYNPSSAYVDAVLRYARRMRVDARAYFGYYAWQVFARTPRGLRRLTGPGLVVAFALAAPAAAAGGNFFQLPSKNIGCAYNASPASLRCDVRSGLKPEPKRTCELDWTGLAIRPTGRATPTCAGDTAILPNAPVLAYGKTWRRGGITCRSRTTGLRCTNRAGHGFTLARQGWRIF
jgi:hypothetical protein